MKNKSYTKIIKAKGKSKGKFFFLKMNYSRMIIVKSRESKAAALIPCIISLTNQPPAPTLHRYN